MEKLSSNLIKQFRYTMGISLYVGEELDYATLNIPRFARSSSEAYEATLYGEKIILVNFFGSQIERSMAIVDRLQKKMNLHVLLFLKQAGSNDRKWLLSNNVSFLTLEGEAFIPFIGMRLFGIPQKTTINRALFSPVAQRLFILLLMAQIHYERNKGILFSGFQVSADGLLSFRGGKQFILDVGEKIEINSGVSFVRAVNELIDSNLVRAIGGTKNRHYTFSWGSRKFFEQGSELLSSPTLKQNFYVDTIAPLSDKYSNEVKPSLLATGVNALSQVTMIAADPPYEFIIDRKWAHALDGDELYATSNKNARYIIKKGRYNLTAFRDLYRKIDPKYPIGCVDPIDLYLMMGRENNERVQGELDELFFGILH